MATINSDQPSNGNVASKKVDQGAAAFKLANTVLEAARNIVDIVDSVDFAPKLEEPRERENSWFLGQDRFQKG